MKVSEGAKPEVLRHPFGKRKRKRREGKEGREKTKNKGRRKNAKRCDAAIISKRKKNGLERILWVGRGHQQGGNAKKEKTLA